MEKLYSQGKEGEQAELARLFADFDIEYHFSGSIDFDESVEWGAASRLFGDSRKYGSTITFMGMKFGGIEPTMELTGLEKVKGITILDESGNIMKLDEDIYILSSFGKLDDKKILQKEYYVINKEGRLSLLGAGIGEEFCFEINGDKIEYKADDIQIGKSIAIVRQPDLIKNMSRTFEQLNNDHDKEMLKHDYLMEEITEEELQQAYQDLARSKNERTQENKIER